MENPATWTRAEHVVAAAINQHEDAAREGYCGLSLVRKITDSLREASLLRDEPWEA